MTAASDFAVGLHQHLLSQPATCKKKGDTSWCRSTYIYTYVLDLLEWKLLQRFLQFDLEHSGTVS